MLADRRTTLDRREGGVRAFVYGNFRPRRREGRRVTDEHLYLFDWYEPRVFYVILAVLLLSCIDALFTLNLLTLGATEANFIMAAMLEYGIADFLAAKISLTAVSLVLLAAVVRRRFYRSLSVEHLLQALFAIYVCVIIYEIYLFSFVFGLRLFPGL
jgi:hypothetical protein